MKTVAIYISDKNYWEKYYVYPPDPTKLFWKIEEEKKKLKWPSTGEDDILDLYERRLREAGIKYHKSVWENKLPVEISDLARARSTIALAAEVQRVYCGAIPDEEEDFSGQKPKIKVSAPREVLPW